MTNGPPEVPSASQLWTKILLGFLAVVLTLVFAGWKLSSWPVRLRYPGERNYVEGMRLAEMLHLRGGLPIYAPASAGRLDAAILRSALHYLLGARLGRSVCVKPGRGLIDCRGQIGKPLVGLLPRVFADAHLS